MDLRPLGLRQSQSQSKCAQHDANFILETASGSYLGSLAAKGLMFRWRVEVTASLIVCCLPWHSCAV